MQCAARSMPAQRSLPARRARISFDPTLSIDAASKRESSRGWRPAKPPNASAPVDSTAARSRATIDSAVASETPAPSYVFGWLVRRPSVVPRPAKPAEALRASVAELDGLARRGRADDEVAAVDVSQDERVVLHTGPAAVRLGIGRAVPDESDHESRSVFLPIGHVDASRLQHAAVRACTAGGVGHHVDLDQAQHPVLARNGV